MQDEETNLLKHTNVSTHNQSQSFGNISMLGALSNNDNELSKVLKEKDRKVQFEKFKSSLFIKNTNEASPGSFGGIH
jgi:hypothetical protein